MTTQNKNVPALRFPEFVESWETVRNDFFYPQIRNGFVGVATPSYAESGIKYLQGKNIKDNKIKENGMIYITNEFHQKNKKSQLKTNDIVMVQSGHVGECALITEEYEGANCHALIVLTPKENVISKFFVYYFYSEYGKKTIDKIKTGNTIEHILASDLKIIEVPKTSKDEQQKIVALLTAVDEKIQQLVKKKDLLKQYKKGVMQKIFNQEIRFKDDNGNDFADWEEKKIGNYLTESREKGTTGDIAKKLTVKLWGKGVYEKNEKILGSSNTKYCKRRAGQFIYSKLDFLNCAFGIVPKELDGYESTVDLPCFDISSNLNSTFLLETVKREEFYLKYGMTADGSRKARRIHADIFLDFPIQIPCIKEQNKIAAFLSAIDDKINLANQQLEKTKEYKKGLLQQMFV